jgi:hypothetical protein
MTIGLILVLIMLALIAYAIYGAVMSFRERDRQIMEVVQLPWPPEGASAYVAAAIAQMMQAQKFRLTSQGPAGMVYTRTFRPAWLVLPCVLLFPIGLLSLFYKVHRDISITLAPSPDGGSTVTVIGRGSSHVRDRINVSLRRLADTSVAAPS